jgi:hypothetical protein
MTTYHASIVFLLVCASLSGCIPAISTSFSIIQRSDPLSDVPTLEQLCRELGLMRLDAAGPPQPPKGTFVCDSGRYFIVFTPVPEKGEINVYFAERKHEFSPEAKDVYANLVRGLQKQFGEAAGSAPTI